jgi:transglutaminase-like putative cysteine protease
MHMNRRQFLQSSASLSAFALLSGRLPFAAAAPEGGAWRVFEVRTQVEVLQPEGVTRVWLPLPLTADTPYQKSLGNIWRADGGQVAVHSDPKYDAGILAAEWPGGQKPTLALSSRFATRDIALDLAGPGRAPAERPADLQRALEPTDLLPTDGIVRQTADEIVRGARTDLDKARAIYEWIVENTFRDPKTRGCGLGDITFMLESRNLSGKCADLNALFVGLARAAGIPARDVYGIRVADSALGYKSLGKSGDITKAQHCRAEFYLTGYGWVPVDPADVRKVVLEEGGGKPLQDPMVTAARRRLFGSWEMNWLAYNTAHDLLLPGASRGKIPFFMYPQAETAEARLDCLDPEHFTYQIGARELTA